MISRHCRCPGCGICDAAEAIDPLKKERTVLRKSLKEQKQRYKELSQMTETYIKRLHATEEDNKRLRKALQTISNGMDINPSEPIRESIIDYFKGIAETALNG